MTYLVCIIVDYLLIQIVSGPAECATDEVRTGNSEEESKEAESSSPSEEA